MSFGVAGCRCVFLPWDTCPFERPLEDLGEARPYVAGRVLLCCFGCSKALGARAAVGGRERLACVCVGVLVERHWDTWKGFGPCDRKLFVC